MKIDLSRLIKREILVLDLNFSEKVDNISCCGKNYRVTSLVDIDGQITNIDRQLYLDCNIKFSVVDSCSRCLKDVEVNIEDDVKAFIVENEDCVLEDEDTVVCNGDKLDFKNIIENTFILNVPERITCDEECKGLCNSCEPDLNEEKCNCHNDEEFVDPRFSKLKDLFKND